MSGQLVNRRSFDEDTAPCFGMNKSYFMLGLKSAGMFLLVFHNSCN